MKNKLIKHIYIDANKGNKTEKLQFYSTITLLAYLKQIFAHLKTQLAVRS